MSSVYARITNALSALGKRRERDTESQEPGARSAAGGSAKRPFRPWEQTDLHHRLETYKPLTWFAKPDSVGPVPCALKGWINQGCDTLRCEHCGATLVYPPAVPYDQRQAAADKFAPCLISKHISSCPWSKTQCDQSLLLYQPSSTSHDELCNLFQALQNKLLRVDVLPDLDAIAIQTVRNAAMPYGSYENVVLCNPAAGALTPRPRRTPNVRITEAGDSSGHEEGAERSPFGTLVSDPAASETIIVQPSKLTPQQKARLLALLGWDLEVLQPDSASGSAAAPYAQSASYSLSHLGVKPKSAGKPGSSSSASAASSSSAAAATGSGSGCGGDGTRYPMSSVVLRCPRCNGRLGLWNFAGVRPVPTGRLTPGQPAEGAAALLLSPTVSLGGAAAAAAAAVDPLSATIAGGQFALHGFSGGAKPFGSGGAAAAPFRFGSGASTAPVFGVAALDAEALCTAAAAVGGSSGSGAFGFGSPLGSPAPPKLLTGTPAPGSTPSALQSTPLAGASGRAAHGGGGALTGHKRKASEQGLGEPVPLDGPFGAGSAVSVGGHDGKRQRFASTPSVTPFAAMTPGSAAVAAAAAAATTPGVTPGAAARSPRLGSTPSAAAAMAVETQLRELDPVNQHKSWCPWVYTGPKDDQKMSGWQHMLSALVAQQQREQQQQAAAAAEGVAAATAGGATPLDAQPGGVPPTPTPTAAGADAGVTAGGASPVDARQLRDNALAAIRSL